MIQEIRTAVHALGYVVGDASEEWITGIEELARLTRCEGFVVTGKNAISGQKFWEDPQEFIATILDLQRVLQQVCVGGIRVGVCYHHSNQAEILQFCGNHCKDINIVLGPQVVERLVVYVGIARRIQ